MINTIEVQGLEAPRALLGTCASNCANAPACSSTQLPSASRRCCARVRGTLPGAWRNAPTVEMESVIAAEKDQLAQSSVLERYTATPCSMKHNYFALCGRSALYTLPITVPALHALYIHSLLARMPLPALTTMTTALTSYCYAKATFPA